VAHDGSVELYFMPIENCATLVHGDSSFLDGRSLAPAA